MTETEGIETAIETATVANAVAVVAATVGSGTGGRDLGGIKALKRFEFRKNRGRRVRSPQDEDEGIGSARVDAPHTWARYLIFLESMACDGYSLPITVPP